jgi:glutamate-1-semialdehyde 2,1-aminomutase
MKNDLSQKIFQRGKEVMPGGVNSPVRSFKSVGGNPFVASKGDGPYIHDVDGNKFVDLVGSWGALLHGHNHPRIKGAIEEALAHGTSFGVTCEKEIELAEMITKSVSSCEMVRLVNSGTEACMSAIRLARGATKRKIIVKFDGHYHGHSDSFLIAAGSGAATLHVSGSAGVTKELIKDTLVIPYNNIEELEKVFKDHKDQIAAVVLEVVCGNMGVVLPQPGFLSKLRSLADQSKTLVIFDEVMTGFRLAKEGVESIYGIRPDLICFGKIIGGGMPVGAYGGKKDLMQQVAPLGPVYQAGTLSGNPLAAAAGWASLKVIEEEGSEIYSALDKKGVLWKDELQTYIQMKGYPASVTQMGSMLSVFFREIAPKNFDEAKKADEEAFKRFFWSLMEQGIYYPPSAFESCFLSTAHDDAVMEKVVNSSKRALDDAFAA